MSLTSIAFLGVQGLLGLAMVGAGGAKLAGQEDQVDDFERFGYPPEFRILTGGLETLAALGLFGAFVFADGFALAGAGLATIVLVGAVVTHFRVGDSLSEAAPASILLVLAIVIILGGL